MEIINKSLLCEVLGIDERLCRIDKLVDNTLFFYTFHNVGEYQNYINIYELVHKCKEYLLDEGYYLVVHPFKVELFEKETKDFIRDFHYPIQSKAIPYDIKRVIEACQWTLDNKDKDE